MDLYGIIGVLLTSKSLWLIVVALSCLYYYLTLQHDYFEKRGVKFIKPLPLFGNLLQIVLRKKNICDLNYEFYMAYPNEKFIGTFEFLQPVYFIRDPDIIKQITIKDFNHFVNRKVQLDENVEPIFHKVLFSIRDQHWKDMRSTLSPAFTGSKMRQMFTLIANCTIDKINYMLKESNGKPLEIELKDLFTRFTSDVIASCSFGIEVNSLKDRENQFYEMGKVITSFNGLKVLKFFACTSFPNIMKFFKISIFDAKMINYFKSLVLDTMAYREKEHIVRPDMINLLMQAKQGKLTHNDSEQKDENVGFATAEESEIGRSSTGTIRKWDDNDVTAQCILFFIAGYEAAAVLMSFISHELAVNPDVQDRLYEEVKEVKEELNGKPLTYEILQKMKYLDMVVSETLRKWAPAVGVDRMCTKEYILDDGNGNKVKLQPGDGLWISAYCLHRDPKYYPEPEKFDPERFSDENKKLINPAAYIPFGLGPRNCIGSRFALMKCKAIMFYVLTAFRIEMSPKTQNPIKFKKNEFNLKPEKDFWVNLRPI